MTRILIFTTAALLTISFNTAQAKMYKYVDEHGQTHYTETPPLTADTKEIKPPPKVDPTEAKQRLDKMTEQLKENRDKRMESKADEEVESQNKATKSKNCKAAKSNLEKLQLGGNRRFTDEKGETSRFSEDELKKKIKDMKQKIKEFCK